MKLGAQRMYFTARRAGRLVRRRGRDHRDRRRQGGAPGHVPDAGRPTGGPRRVGSPPIGTGSSFADTTNPIELLLPQLSELRADNPALEYGASYIRYSHHGVLAVSRIDAASKREYLVLTNSGTSGAKITFQTSTPSSSWNVLFGGGSTQTTGANGKMTVTVPAVGALVLEAANPIPVSFPPKPVVKVAPDVYTSLIAVNASVTGPQPLTIAFAVKRAHSSVGGGLTSTTRRRTAASSTRRSTRRESSSASLQSRAT